MECVEEAEEGRSVEGGVADFGEDGPVAEFEGLGGCEGGEDGGGGEEEGGFETRHGGGG